MFNASHVYRPTTICKEHFHVSLLSIYFLIQQALTTCYEPALAMPRSPQKGPRGSEDFLRQPDQCRPQRAELQEDRSLAVALHPCMDLGGAGPGPVPLGERSERHVPHRFLNFPRGIKPQRPKTVPFCMTLLCSAGPFPCLPSPSYRSILGSPDG